MKTKKTNAVKAALIAFRGLSGEEETLVLKELGLVRETPPQTPVAGGANAGSGATEMAWIDELLATSDETGIGLPHPDHMTPEQREQYNASFRTPDTTDEKTPQKRRASKGR